MPNHPTRQQLERFMHGELPRPEIDAVVRHLLTGCPRCVEVTRRLWELGERASFNMERVMKKAMAEYRSLSARAS